MLAGFLVADTVAVVCFFIFRKPGRSIGVVHPTKILSTGIDQQSFTRFVKLADQGDRWLEIPSPRGCTCVCAFEPPNELFFHACSRKKRESAEPRLLSEPPPRGAQDRTQPTLPTRERGFKHCSCVESKSSIWRFSEKQLPDAHASFSFYIK